MGPLSFALYLDVAGCVRAIDGAFSFGGNVKGRSLLWSAAMLIIVGGRCVDERANRAQSACRGDQHRRLSGVSWNDPLLAVPTLRKLAREGAVAEGMMPVNPTVTWPNHTAMVTGVRPERHSVLYNGWAVRGGEGERLRSTEG